MRPDTAQAPARNTPPPRRREEPGGQSAGPDEAPAQDAPREEGAPPARSGPLHRLYPEVWAGGFTRVDGTVEFYGRVRALLRREMVVLDFGAGRGAGAEDPVPYRRDLRRLRGRVREVIGLDIDPAVQRNPWLDRACVVAPGDVFPLADESIDLVIADATFEHVRDPEHASREIDRVLRPGGWVCARTPNRWGPTAACARLVPNRWHARVLSVLQPDRRREDVFPTAYRMNSRRALRRLFAAGRYRDHTYGMVSEPAYAGGSVALWRLMMAVSRLSPEAFADVLFVFLRKRADARVPR